MASTEIKLLQAETSTVPDAAVTPGMKREELLATPGTWIGKVRVVPKTGSGWHHHGDNDTYVYVISGRQRADFGSGGNKSCEAGPGEVLHVPKQLIHRESNPGSQEVVSFVVRVGSGPLVVNVDGPE